MKPDYFANTLWFLLPLLVGAAPAPVTGRGVISSGNSTISPEMIRAVAPDSKSCDGAVAPDECATSDTAAQNIAKSFDKYQVTSLAEQAAIISLLALESGEFKFSRNKYPGIAGQGTRNMQSPEYNAKYADSIPALSDKLEGVSKDPSKVLDLLLSEKEWDFGSGAWFLTTQCSAEVRSALQTGSEAGWAGYIEKCVRTSITESRKSYWTEAIKVLGVKSS
ncbi:hypothetical protein BBP40_009177 [Aspergillus hancockii]|nr:hypothetical protein BBP40_009177 [Aspergillus hancockii]